MQALPGKSSFRVPVLGEDATLTSGQGLFSPLWWGYLSTRTLFRPFRLFPKLPGLWCRLRDFCTQADVNLFSASGFLCLNLCGLRMRISSCEKDAGTSLKGSPLTKSRQPAPKWIMAGVLSQQWIIIRKSRVLLKRPFRIRIGEKGKILQKIAQK